TVPLRSSWRRQLPHRTMWIAYQIQQTTATYRLFLWKSRRCNSTYSPHLVMDQIGDCPEGPPIIGVVYGAILRNGRKVGRKRRVTVSAVPAKCLGHRSLRVSSLCRSQSAGRPRSHWAARTYTEPSPAIYRFYSTRPHRCRCTLHC